MEAFGIFEGGGVKGLAHIGALAAAERREVRFVGVAGTSAGAIIAALVAVGYRASDLYAPNLHRNKGIFDIDYFQFVERKTWDQLKKLVKDAQKTYGKRRLLRLSKRKLCGLLWKSIWFYQGHRKLIGTLTDERGIFDATRFANWLEPHLAKKIREKAQDEISTARSRGTTPDPKWEAFLKDPASKVCFEHVDTPLKIIATNLTKQSPRVFCREETPTRAVSEAVAASISIPFFFKPTYHDEPPDKLELVDGGLLSNFPAWVFDNERRTAPPLARTLGFKFAAEPLVTGGETGLLQFAQNLALTALTGTDQLQTRQIDNLDIIPLKVTTKTLQFDLESDDRMALYERGFQCANDALGELMGLLPAEEMRLLLSSLNATMLQVINRSDVRLRLSVLLPSGMFKDHLKVQFTYNFDEEDADDLLELPTGTGVAGHCWETRRAVIGDMEKARQTFNSQWKMTKYQQALVRRTLKSCLCLPILKRQTALDGSVHGQIPVGVFSIDSDQDLIADFGANFGENKIVYEAIHAATLIGRFLTGHG